MRCPHFILLLLAPATTLYVGPQQLVAHRPGRLRRCAPPVASDRIADSHRKHAMRKQIKQQEELQRATNAQDEIRVREVARYRGTLLQLEKQNAWQAMLQELHAMHKAELAPDSACLAAAVRACGRAREWRRIAKLSGEYPYFWSICDDAAASTLLFEAHARRGEHARCLAYLTAGSIAGADAVEPRAIELALIAAANEGAWTAVLQLHEFLQRSADVSDAQTEVSSAAMLALLRAHGHTTGWRACVRQLLRAAPSAMLGVTHWSAALEACEADGAWRAAAKLYQRSAASGVVPDASMAGATLRALARAGEMEAASGIVAQALASPRERGKRAQLDLTRGDQAAATLSAAVDAAASTGRWEMAHQISQLAGRNYSLLDGHAHSLAIVACARTGEPRAALGHLVHAAPLTARTDVVAAALEACRAAGRVGDALGLYRRLGGAHERLENATWTACLRAAVRDVLRGAAEGGVTDGSATGGAAPRALAALSLLQAHEPRTLDLGLWTDVLTACVDSGQSSALLEAVDGAPHPEAGSDPTLRALYQVACSARIQELAVVLGAAEEPDRLASSASQSFIADYNEACSVVFRMCEDRRNDAEQRILSGNDAPAAASVADSAAANVPLTSVVAHFVASLSAQDIINVKIQAEMQAVMDNMMNVSGLHEKPAQTSVDSQTVFETILSDNVLGLQPFVEADAAKEWAEWEEWKRKREPDVITMQRALDVVKELRLTIDEDAALLQCVALASVSRRTAGQNDRAFGPVVASEQMRSVFEALFLLAPPLDRGSYHAAIALMLYDTHADDIARVLPFVDASRSTLGGEALPPNASAPFAHACVLLHRMRRSAETRPNETTYALLARGCAGYAHAAWLCERIRADGVALSSRILSHLLSVCQTTTEHVALLRLALDCGATPSVGQLAFVALGALGVGMLDASGSELNALRVDECAEPGQLLPIWEIAKSVLGSERDAERLEKVTDVVVLGLAVHTLLGTQPASFLRLQLNAIDPETWPLDVGLLAGVETGDGVMSDEAKESVLLWLQAAHASWAAGLKGGSKARYAPTLTAIARGSVNHVVNQIQSDQTATTPAGIMRDLIAKEGMSFKSDAQLQNMADMLGLPAAAMGPPSGGNRRRRQDNPKKKKRRGFG